MRLERVRLVLLDLDGTVYEGSHVVPGAAAAVDAIRAGGRRVRFTSNTDSVTPDALLERLAGLGVDARPDELVTPLLLAVRLFERSQPPARVLALAAPGVRELLGRHLVPAGEAATHVLVTDPGYGATYEEYDTAFRALRSGAELVATQRNRLARRDDGEHLDAGGYVALLEYAADVEARVLGKPSPDFLRIALESAGVAPEDALVVGDDRSTDVAAGRSLGAHTVLVRTGKAGGGSGPDPDVVVDSVADVPELLGRRRAANGGR